MFCKDNTPLNPHTQPLNFPKQMMSFAKDDGNLTIPQNGNDLLEFGNDLLELGCTEASQICLYEERWKEGGCRTTKEVSWEGSPAR